MNQHDMTEFYHIGELDDLEDKFKDSVYYNKYISIVLHSFNFNKFICIYINNIINIYMYRYIYIYIYI